MKRNFATDIKIILAPSLLKIGNLLKEQILLRKASKIQFHNRNMIKQEIF